MTGRYQVGQNIRVFNLLKGRIPLVLNIRSRLNSSVDYTCKPSVANFAFVCPGSSPKLTFLRAGEGGSDSRYFHGAAHEIQVE